MANLDIPCEVIKPKKGDLKGIITLTTFGSWQRDTKTNIDNEEIIKVYW